MTRYCYAAIILAVIGIAYVSWFKQAYPLDHVCRECPEPIPFIDDHVAAVMRQDCPACPACPDCPTYDTLKRAGLEIICENAFGKIPPINYWPVEVSMACNKIREIRVTNKAIKVTATK